MKLKDILQIREILLREHARLTAERNRIQEDLIPLADPSDIVREPGIPPTLQRCMCDPKDDLSEEDRERFAELRQRWWNMQIDVVELERLIKTLENQDI